MCGLFGWQLTNVAESERLVLAAVLMLHNDERGGDSWGYWTPGKVPVRGTGTFCETVPAIALAQLETCLAHTRFATVGSVKLENAHPFIVGSVTGAHNGAVFNKSTMDAQYPARDFDVDSMHLVAHIAERKALKELTGYGAITYTDSLDKRTIHMGRFQGGELAVFDVLGAPGESRGLVWSSNAEHLELACRLAGLRTTPYKVKEGKVYEAVDGLLYRTQRTFDVSARPASTTLPAKWSSGGGTVGGWKRSEGSGTATNADPTWWAQEEEERQRNRESWQQQAADAYDETHCEDCGGIYPECAELSDSDDYACDCIADVPARKEMEG